MNYQLLKKLSEAFGPSGFEDEVKDIIKYELKGLEFFEDNYGNLIFYKSGKNNSKKILIEAHIDEIGFMVYAKNNGYIKLAPLGGWDARILLSHLVKIKTNYGFVYGVFSTVPPHLGKSNFEINEVEKLIVDVGDNYDKVEIGDVGVIDYGFREISDNIIIGKAFDNRVGTYILIELAKNVNNYYDTYFVFCVEEEVGLRGARALIEHLNFDIAIIIETTSGESPYLSKEEQSSYISKGPVITLADKSVIVKPSLLKEILSSFKKYDIPYQIKRPLISSTDAGMLNTKAPSIIISVPARYIHTPIQMAHKNDIKLTYEFLKKFLENA
ncbi:MAG: M20/M25/M40 family metallo-hydrolase [candidate division WOR-3 bacterium]